MRNDWGNVLILPTGCERLVTAMPLKGPLILFKNDIKPMQSNIKVDEEMMNVRHDICLYTRRIIVVE